MKAPYRIERPASRRLELAPAAGAGPGPASGGSPAEASVRDYLDRLMRMIPAEVVGLYLVGDGVVPRAPAPAAAGFDAQRAYGLTAWMVVCFVGLILIRARGSAKPSEGKGPEWPAVAISAVAFVIWIYTIGGPFREFGVQVPWIGSLLVLAWTFFVPLFYTGTTDA